MFFIRKRIPVVAISTNFKWEVVFGKKTGDLAC